VNEPVIPCNEDGDQVLRSATPAAPAETGVGAIDGTERGSSTYATGGGGVSFAHRVATVYLTSILTAGRRIEGSELPVRKVSFQTGPVHPVDDLLIECGDESHEVTVAVACRATPNFVQSHDETVKLVASLLAEVEKFDTNSHHVAVAAAGRNNQWDQLQKVCDIARSHSDAQSFKASLDTDGRWLAAVRDRLTQFEKMVAKVVARGTSTVEIQRLSWNLLRRLYVRGFAVQSPDEADRTAAATLLDRVAAHHENGVAVRDRLEVESTRYDATGAVVDLGLLRRDLFTVLNSTATRSKKARTVLTEHRAMAAASVRTTIGDEISGGPVELAFAAQRDQLTSAIREVGDNRSALVVSGESGTGKSALTLSAIAEIEAADPGLFEAVVLNFRALPRSILDLNAAVGVSLQAALDELSAPSRVLVIDAADAALESSTGLLTDLAVAARSAGVGLVVVTAAFALGVVTAQIRAGYETTISSFKMTLLGDEDIALVADRIPLMRTVLRHLPANSLMRRPVVLDLLARTGLEPDSSLGEWECLQLVWKAIVRNDARAHGGSAEAREQTLLAIAASTMQLPADHRPEARADASAVDALRQDHLIAPPSPYQSLPVFAHDEVRRYAAAILLVRGQNPVALLEAASAPRWALSAATLACKGLLKAPGGRPSQVFVDLVSKFHPFASVHGPRWADVPVEAVLETSFTYECLKSAFDGGPASLTLNDVVRVIEQRYTVDGLIDPLISGPVAKVLIDREVPWRISEQSFELLVKWLQALVAEDAPEGQEQRVRLRGRLLAYWQAHPQTDSDKAGAATKQIGPTRSHRTLNHRVTEKAFVETLALLGLDLDDAAEQCLRAIADDAPGFLAPAADSPLSARAIAQRNPELLADLMEAYYINNNPSGHHDRGVRDHRGRWTGSRPPFALYYYGGFWQLFQHASLKTSARVLNSILNSGAKARVELVSPLTTRSEIFDAPVIDPSAVPPGEQYAGELERSDRGAVLNLDGAARLYVGDRHVWSWYRGTTVGPYPAMSALQALERIADHWLALGASPELIVDPLLVGCENLAVPGMLFGLLARHIDKVDTELDAFLAEPMVWELEFSRYSNEYSGLRATTEGLVNLDRRSWTPREVAMRLVLKAEEPRRERLKTVADKLVENGDQLGISQELTKSWAAHLNFDQYRQTPHGDGYMLEVVAPPELQAAQEAHAAYLEVVSTTLRLQGRYLRYSADNAAYAELSSIEIATDLTTGKSLLEADPDSIAMNPMNAVANLVRAAVDRAAIGEVDALGNEEVFVTDFVLGLASSFHDADDQRDEGQYFDIGADRAVAQSVPKLLTAALSPILTTTGRSIADVASSGLAMASKAPLETRLFLARGSDAVWREPCRGEPCIHQIAMDWMIESARTAEIGPWDQSGQRSPSVPIAGNVAERLQQLPEDLVDIPVLDAAIRGLGSGAAADNCCSGQAAALLGVLLKVQSSSIVAQAIQGWSPDGDGQHTLIAARALLQRLANDEYVGPVLAHFDVLSADADVLSNFLHGLAGAGAENEALAGAARVLWPELLRHAISHFGDEPSPYQDSAWGKWVAAALLPNPLVWANVRYNEVEGEPIDWVRASDLIELIDGWLLIGRGRLKCVDALIDTLRKLPIEVQVQRGLGWVTDLCIQGTDVSVYQSWHSDDWLKEIRSEAEAMGHLSEWQTLVDSMVVAGNGALAPYSM
jgi:hypothetical protein